MRLLTLTATSGSVSSITAYGCSSVALNWSMSNIVKRTSTVSRILGALLEDGMVWHNAETGRYSLGMALVENLSPPDIFDRYLSQRTDGYRATEFAHFARAKVSTR